MSTTDDTSQLLMLELNTVASRNTVRVTNQQTQKCKKRESEHGGDCNGGDDRFQGGERRCGGKKYGKRKKRWKKGRWGKGISKRTVSIPEVVLTIMG